MFENTKKFCDSSCAASYNNKGRVQAEETKLKIKKALLTITFFIRMSRAYVSDKPFFHLYTKYYEEVI